MAGHSKWSNIKGKKGKTDTQRAKLFTKTGREIVVAVKEGGGGNPEMNSRLKDVIAKAKTNNVPNDNIERSIKKALGTSATDNYEAVRYEGYGPNGVAMMVDTLTDNRNRTAGDLRHYFDKSSGNLGTTGCVSYIFEEKGILVIDGKDKDENKAMEDAIESGADDFYAEDDVFEVLTDPKEFSSVREGMESLNYTFLSAEIEQIPANFVELIDEDQIKKMERLVESLEDNDDVQNIWHNWKQDED